MRPSKSEHYIMTIPIHTIEIDHGKKKLFILESYLKLDPMNKKLLNIVLGTQRYFHCHYQKESKICYGL